MPGRDNSITLTGNLTRDPELRFGQSGIAVATLGMAVNDSRKAASGEWEEQVSFVDLVVFGDLAQNCQDSLAKGNRITVAGKIRMDSWDDKESGQPRSKLVVIADDVAASLRFATAQIKRTPKAETTKTSDDWSS